jgi:nucleotide sugar dehydrogenase
MNISVIGIGKLGLGFALLLEKNGYNVLGVDIFEDYVLKLNNKSICFTEPGYNNLLQKSKKFNATTNLKEGLEFSDIIFIIVQTPNGGGEKFYDHTILSNLLCKINKMNISNKNIIIGCTVMPGYIDNIAKTLLPDCFISYNPEFVAQGEIINGFENSDIILVGTENKNLVPELEKIYSFNKNATFCLMTPLEAEIVKISLPPHPFLLHLPVNGGLL